MLCYQCTAGVNHANSLRNIHEQSRDTKARHTFMSKLDAKKLETQNINEQARHTQALNELALLVLEV